MSVGGTLVMPAADLDLSDIDFPELIFLADQDTQVLGSAPASDWPAFLVQGRPLRFEIDTTGVTVVVLDATGTRLCEIQQQAHVQAGDVFILSPQFVY